MQNIINQPSQTWYQPNKENLILWFFILLKLIICAFPFEYDYFVDELYTLAHTQHLDYGYMVIPPLLPFCLAIVRFLFGSSFFALHLFSACTGVVVLIITKMIVKKMNGGWLALLLALVCVTLAPVNITVEL
jgi:dolichyl-phosphate-mannose--protein O-mannosyl transferase